MLRTFVGRVVKASALRAPDLGSIPTFAHHLVGLVVKVSASREADLGSIPAFGVNLFLGLATRVTKNSGKPVVTLLLHSQHIYTRCSS